MTTLKTKMAFDLALDFVSTLDLQTASAPGGLKRRFAFSDGAGLNAANRTWTDQRTLAASANESLDLAGTALVDAFGTAISFARVKALIVSAATTNTNNVIVGATGSNAFINWVGSTTDAINVRPGGLFVLIAPDATAYAVTAATGDLLKIANSAGTTGVTYQIAIVGAAT
jgi:hypothetical protein